MLNHIAYILKLFFTNFLIKLPLQLLGMIVVPIVLLFYIRDRRIASSGLSNQRLPKFLSWFDVGDSLDLKYGLNGDLGYQSQFLLDTDPLSERKLQQALIIIYDRECEGKQIPWFKIYKMRVNWLAFRNPVNRFQYNVLGAKVKDFKYLITLINHTQDQHIETPESIGEEGLNFEDIQEVGNWAYSGYRYRNIATDNGDIREYYIVYRYPFNPRYCFRARLGYKLSHNPLENDREVVQGAFSVNPFKSFTGIK